MTYYLDNHDLEDLKKSETIEDVVEDVDLKELFSESSDLKEKTLSVELLTEINESLKSLKSFVIKLLLRKETKKVEESVQTTQNSDIIDDIAQSRMNENVKEYLLHRGTKDYEYQSSFEEPNMYNIKEDTEFHVVSDGGDELKTSHNPVISIWVPESKIKILTPKEKTGTWKELGENPHNENYLVSVSPGKYEIYSELNE